MRRSVKIDRVVLWWAIMGWWVAWSLGDKPQCDADWGDQKAVWLAPAAAGPLVAPLKMNDERWIFPAALVFGVEPT